MSLRSSALALLGAASLLAAAAAALMPATASAHPLGNFTVNHYTRIDVTDSGVTVLRVLDLAEIPAFQEIHQIDTDGDGSTNSTEIEEWAGTKSDELLAGMTLDIGGERVALRRQGSSLATPEGQGGLRVLRLETTYTATLPEGWRDGDAIEFDDTNDEGRVGWREVVVRGGPGIEIASSDVPSTSISDALRAYPDDSLSSPLDVRSASAKIERGVGTALLTAEHPKSSDAVRGNPDGALGRFAGLIAKDELGPGVATLALLAAVAFGAIHALSPGHGKTVVAAYLVGSRGTWKHALFLAGVVTVTHTSTVYLLGFIALYFSDYVLAEDLYPWLGVASGVLILAMGALLFAGRLRASELLLDSGHVLRGALPSFGGRALADEKGALTLAMPARDTAGESHAHDDDQPHDHGDGLHEHADTGDHAEHRHGLGPAHSHRVPGQDGEPVTFRGLLGLGVFGGMIPCPSAIVVMLSAIALHRVGFGLLLIVAFSIGLASVLTAIGFALVFAQRAPLLTSTVARFEGNPAGRFAVRVFPILAAMAVIGAGAVITMRAVSML